MARTTTATKADLEQILDDVQDCLEGAYTPESSREDLAAAIGKALDLLDEGDEEENGGDEDEEEDDETED
jgi:hypothetical protein